MTADESKQRTEHQKYYQQKQNKQQNKQNEEQIDDVEYRDGNQQQDAHPHRVQTRTKVNK